MLNIADPKTKLLGKNSKEYAEILQWASLSTLDFLTNLAVVFHSHLGLIPFNKKAVEESQSKVDKILGIFEARLANYTYLVGERLSLADLFSASLFIRGFETVFGAEWRKAHPNVTRWFKTVYGNSILNKAFPDLKYATKAAEFVPPKKEKKEKPAAAKKEAAPKKEVAAEEEAPKEAPKPKHPLELLGKPKAALDEWKRKYSNEETREVAIPWFWANQYDPAEWSLWKVDYKYNDELTLTFMSNNLIGGFFNRLSASTKYMFGTMVVYGENNNNGITGVFLVRGQDYKPAFDVAPDWESYDFTKLDADNADSKDWINNLLAWDQPLVINGEKREIADGKVFK